MKHLIIITKLKPMKPWMRQAMSPMMSFNSIAPLPQVLEQFSSSWKHRININLLGCGEGSVL